MFYPVIVAGAWLVWHLVFRIQVVGREYLPKEGGFVIASNHLSAIDPVFEVIARFWGRRLIILAKAELFQVNWFVSWFLSHVGVVAVERGKGDTQLMDEVCRQCGAGRGLLIYPEGTRSKDGQIGKIKSGAFVVASAAGVDMIPCRIIYNTPDGFMHLFCRVRVCFGPAIPAAQLAMEGGHDMRTLRANKQRLREAWEQLYEENKFS